MHTWNLLGLTAVLLALSCGCASVHGVRPEKAPGLIVDQSGVLRKGGQPFRGIGVNYFDAFARTLKDPNDTSYREGFAELARLGIPFARFMACGFWPSDWKLYREDKERYFRLLDGVVKAAEEHGVGLIPSLLWYSAAVPDLAGEPRDQWGNPQSKTHAFMRRYVQEVVTRYKESPAIWGWEFGNEYSLDADLPNAAEHRPKVVAQLGTAASRSARDDLAHDMIATAFAEFAREVRKHDPHRVILTGNSLPRASAWHQWKEKSWKQDDEEQFAERLALDNPDPVNALTIHVYDPTEKRFGREVGVEELLKLAMGVARKARKPLFVGEFGASASGEGGEEKAKAQFAAVLAAIEKTGVPLAALWVYDFRGQAESWNVTATNARSYQLRAIAEANRRLQPPLLANQGGPQGE
jgi:hypothetical protein